MAAFAGVWGGLPWLAGSIWPLRLHEPETVDARGKRLRQVMRALHQINRSIFQQTDEAALLTDACRIAVEEGGYRFCWAGYAFHNEEKSITPKAQFGLEEGYLETLRLTWADTPRGHGPTGTAVRTRQPSICQNVPTDPRFEPWRKQALERGYQSVAAFPLMMEHEVFGAINFYADVPNAFDEEEIALLQELADDLSLFILTLRSQTEAAQAKNQLAQAEALLSQVLDSAAEAVYAIDAHGQCIYCNSRTVKLLGYPSKASLLRQPLHTLIHHSQPDGSPYPFEDSPVFKTLSTHEPSHVEDEVIWRRDGSSFLAEYWAHPLTRGPQTVGVVVTFFDITLRRAHEARRLQAQKLESLGYLTNGIAHHFNNALTVIMGILDLLRKNEQQGSMAAQLIDEAAQKASEITGQVQHLVNFSRQSPLNPERINLNRLLDELAPFLEEALPQGIELRIDKSDTLFDTLADRNELEAVALGLIFNAREALEGKGRITLTTFNASITQPKQAAELRLAVGDYVVIKISDTGPGMSPEVQERAFLPFYTTKEVGQGQGLGLSHAYAFAGQSGGTALLESAPGQGASLSLYLPRA